MPTATTGIMVSLMAFYTGLEDRAVCQAWVSDFAAALDQRDTGAYVNFLGDEGPTRVQAANDDPGYRLWKYNRQ